MTLTKVSGGILDPGINVAGIVTATGFDGPFVGGTGDSINAGIITATGLDVNGNGDISGNLVVGGNLTANGDFTTLNTTLREVELLRVDAQDDNVAAGIITQRGTGNIFDLYDTGSAVFSVRDGGNVIMGAGAGSNAPHAPLHIRTGTTGAITTLLKLHGPFTSNTGSEGTAIDFGTASDTSTGARIIGSREASGAKGALRFCTGRENDAGFNSGHMVIDETGSIGIGSTTPTAKLDVRGGSHIYGDGQAAIEWGDTAYAGHLSYDSSNNPVIRSASGKALIFHTNSGNERMRIKSDGTVLINNERNITHSSLCIDKPDAGSATLKFKNGGSDYGYIQLTNGEDLHYYLPTSSTTSDHVFYTAGQQRVIMLGTGYVGIGTGNPSALLDVNKGTQANIQLKTTQAGSINSMSFAIGSATNQIFSRGANSSTPRNFIIGMGSTEVVRIDTTGNIILKDPLAQGNSLVHYIKATDINGANQYYFGMLSTGNQDLYVTNSKNANLRFQTNGSTRWKIDGDPGHLLPETAGVVNIGSSSAGIGSVYLTDSGKIHLGSDQDLVINCDGSDTFFDNSVGHTYFRNSSGTSGGLLFRSDGETHISNYAANEYRIKTFNQGAVELFYAAGTYSTPKIKTTATGVTVDGEVVTSQDYPDLRPRLDFNFAAEKKLDPRITYYRTGPASFVNKLGKIVLVGDNTPRFDHDPFTGESKGLLMEHTRVNFLAYSNFIGSYGSGGSWAYGVGTDVFSASSGSQLSTNPDGSSPAYHYAPSSTAGYHRFNRSVTLDQYDTSYVVSVFAKRVTEGSVSGLNRYLEIEISGNFALNGAPTGHSGAHGMSSVTFDLQGDGAIESESTTTNGYVGSPKMEKFADGWWRLSYVFNPGTNDGSSSLTGQIWFGHPNSLGNDDGSETGNGNPSFYLWGAMIEKGGHLTSYIPNHGPENSTRGQEFAVIDGEDFTNFYNTSESSVLAVGTMQRPVADQGQLNILHIGDDNEDGHGIFREHGTRDVWYHIRNNNNTPTGGNLNPNGFGDWDAGEEARIAVAFKDGDQAISVNGGNQITATVTNSYPTQTSTISKMWIGSHGTGSFFEGHIKRIAYYPKLLTDNQLNTLTA